jgi:hypothetical protein
MVSGIDLEELAAQVAEMRDSKKDYVVPDRRMFMSEGAMVLTFDGNVAGSYDVQPVAHSQIAT